MSTTPTAEAASSVVDEKVGWTLSESTDADHRLDNLNLLVFSVCKTTSFL